MRTLLGEKTDRVPISLYEYDGFHDSWIRDYLEYVEILRYAEGKTDKMYFWAPLGSKPEIFYGVLDEDSIQEARWEDEKGSTYTRTIVKTPKGSVSATTRENKGFHTAWTIEPLCKSKEDAEKVLSLPYNPWRPSVESFFTLDKRLGGSGIVLGDIPDALCLTVQLFGFAEFLKIYMKNKGIVMELMDFFHERIFTYLRHLLEEGVVTLYRIFGPEYATPPFLNPREFDRLVTSYDADLVDLLHRYKAFARIHSHGKVKSVLNSFRNMRIDAIDPLEPPPDGDVELKEARRILGNETTLLGNIEERLLEIGSRDDVERQVKKAMEEGASGGRFILCPTAMPLTTPLSRKIQENIIQYIDCGLKYGSLDAS